jgi:tRNA(Ile)-lysidine synthetase-like protein
VEENPSAIRARVERDIRRYELIPPGGEVVCLVSGGADSTCLLHVLRELGYAASALHGLRGEESAVDERFCRDTLGAEVVDGRTTNPTEDELRRVRYSFATDRLRATGHTASDQVETVLLKILASGAPGGIKRRREDGVVRPLLGLRRAETRAYCVAEGLAYREDSSNPDTKRGLIRARVLPLLEELDPRAEESLLKLADRRTVPPALAALFDSAAGSARLELGEGVTAVREYDRVWLEQSPVKLEGEVRWGDWLIASGERGLMVRPWRAGDRLAGRRKKVQDVFVDAKVPRSEREAWPLVVRGDEVVAVPGLATAPGWEGAIVARRRS